MRPKIQSSVAAPPNELELDETEIPTTTCGGTKGLEFSENLVLSTIANYCTEESDFQVICDIGKALRYGGDNNDELMLELLQGGKTNYSFKVFLKNDPDTALFAKLYFARALWNPDITQEYDIERSSNELFAMKQFSNVVGTDKTCSDRTDGGAQVPQPFCCIDVVPGTSKLLLTQWAPALEPWANQFIRGKVDRRLVPNVAESLARFNLIEGMDPKFNENIRPFIRSVFPQYATIYEKILLNEEPSSNERNDDSCLALGRKLGVRQYARYMELLEEQYMRRDVLSHADCHVFNILVENELDGEDVLVNGDSSSFLPFGEAGSVFFCDFEMAIVGPMGLDAGAFQAWPIACAFCHAVQGHTEKAQHLLQVIEEFWTHYAATLAAEQHKKQDNTEEDKEEDEWYMRNALRKTVAWCGFYLQVAYYMLALFRDKLPLENVSNDEAKRAIGSIGAVGLRLMEYLVVDNEKPFLSSEELLSQYHTTLRAEIDMLSLAAKQKKQQQQKSSQNKSSLRLIQSSTVRRRSSESLVFEMAAAHHSSRIPPYV